MYSGLKLSLKYLQYYLSASNGKGHGTHSPFVFEFITKVLNDKTHYPDYDKVEGLRRSLVSDPTILTIEDPGAGSSTTRSNQRTVASIAKNAAKPRKFGQLLYRMARYYQPKTILELGTSLGITSSYLALAKQDSTIITMEGVEAVASKARKNFQTLNLNNISLLEGNFDKTLSTILSPLSSIDFAFIDGNHRLEPTARYFHQLLPKTNNDSILVFDDIHWSAEMEEAWSVVKTHPSVRCTIDLFFVGIVLFRREFAEKQHFSIKS